MTSVINNSLRALREACETTGPLVLTVSGPGVTQPVRCVFRRPFLLIGSSREADLYLPDAAVSPWHAYLQVVEGHVVCADLHSATGTHWPTGPRRNGCLSPGTSLRIGPFDLRLGERAGGLLTPPPFDFDQPPALALEPLNCGSWNVPLSCTSLVTLVGSSPACGVRLQGDGVAEVHCCLLRARRAGWLIHLGGNRRTIVNRKSIRWSRLGDGDLVEVGGFVFRVQAPATPALPQPSLRAMPKLPRQWTSEIRNRRWRRSRTGRIMSLSLAQVEEGDWSPLLGVPGRRG
jgi:hypothetical protein